MLPHHERKHGEDVAVSSVLSLGGRGSSTTSTTSNSTAAGPVRLRRLRSGRCDCGGSSSSTANAAGILLVRRVPQLSSAPQTRGVNNPTEAAERQQGHRKPTDDLPSRHRGRRGVGSPRFGGERGRTRRRLDVAARRRWVQAVVADNSALVHLVRVAVALATVTWQGYVAGRRQETPGEGRKEKRSRFRASGYFWYSGGDDVKNRNNKRQNGHQESQNRLVSRSEHSSIYGQSREIGALCRLVQPSFTVWWITAAAVFVRVGGGLRNGGVGNVEGS